MKKIRVGIFGYSRGSSYVDGFLQNGAEIVAVCEKRSDRVARAKEKLGENIAIYDNFDDFIEHDMDAVLLANFFHEHTPYAIRCLEKNIHVFSECLSNSTMAEGVQLVEAAERSSAIYMLAENYPYMLFNQEMKRVYEGGTLGKCLYAEGEYCHANNPYNFSGLTDSLKHWRNNLPRTYYVTHSLAPIMFATGANPVRVTAMPVFCPVPTDAVTASFAGDKAAIITTLNDDKSVFKFTANAGWGASASSYRLCCLNGQIENLRGTDGRIMLRYNDWALPEGAQTINEYAPQWTGEDADLIQLSGHGGGDFCVIRAFCNAIRENKPHPFDVYFSTRLASVAILGARSMLEFGVPYDIPDFRKKEDRDKYRDDHISPFYYSDGREPTMPCCSKQDFRPSEQQIENFTTRANELPK